MRYTYLIYAVGAALSVATLGSCSRADEIPFAGGEGQHSDATVEIALSIPSLATRTSVGEDDGRTLTPKWDVGDSFGLLIRSADGSELNERFDAACEFTHIENAHDLNNELFTGLVPRMASGTYDYYAIYPMPSEGSISGTTVRCTVPSIQTGEYDGGSDLMWAHAVGEELDQNLYNNLDFRFQHLTHALKIHLPENIFDGRAVTDMRINFPRAVAGDLTLDMVSGIAMFAGNETGVTVHFAEPTAGGRDCWVYIMPGDMSGGKVSFMVTDGEEYSFPLSSDGFGNLNKQHITPVILPAMEIRRQQDYKITVDYERLGEPVTTLTSFTLGDVIFPGIDMPVMLENVPATGFVKNDSQTVSEFSIRMFVDEAERFAASGAQVLPDDVVLESEHTANLLGDLRSDRGGFNIKNLNANGFAINAPYLFYEDFEQSVNNSSNSSNNNGTSMDAANLSGWTGTRWHTEQNALYYTTHSVTVFNGNYGRVDSPALVNIKPNVSVSISITYDLGGNRSGGVGNTGTNGKSVFGTTTKSNALSGNSVDNQVYSEVYDRNGNLNDMRTRTHQIGNCTSMTRFSWVADQDGTSTNRDFNFKLDNIKISIIP